MRSNLLKLTSLILVLVLCMGILAGCGNKNGTESETEAETVPTYETVEIVDEPNSIDTLNDAVTTAIADYINNTYEQFDEYCNCESHAIIADTYTDGADSFDVLAYRSEVYVFDPMTGYTDSYMESGKICVMSFVKDGSKYTVSEYAEYDDISDVKSDVFATVTEIPDSLDMTPIRYVKDGEIYLAPEDRSFAYINNIIAELLTTDSVPNSYKAYITNNKDLYNKLLDAYRIGDYLITEFLKGGNNDAKGYIMYRALEDILELNDESIEEKPADEHSSQEYFDTLLAYTKDMCMKDGIMKTAFVYPTWCKIIEQYLKNLSNEEYVKEIFVYAVPDSIVLHKDGKSLTYAKGDDKFYEILRLNTYWYVPTSSLYSDGTGTPQKVVDTYYSANDILTDVYIEYVYDNSGSKYIFAGAGYLTLVPTESNEKVYDVYKSNYSDPDLARVLDACFE